MYFVWKYLNKLLLSLLYIYIIYNSVKCSPAKPGQNSNCREGADLRNKMNYTDFECIGCLIHNCFVGHRNDDPLIS